MGYQGDVFAKQQQANKYAESCGKKTTYTRITPRSPQIKRTITIGEQTNSSNKINTKKIDSRQEGNWNHYPNEFVGLPTME